MDIKRINPTPRWSDITVFNHTAYFVEVADDSTADIESQIKQVFQQTERSLASVGSDLSSLLSVTIYLTDLAHLGLFNQLWEAWLPEGKAPSRACINAQLADPSLLVEITVVAAILP
ncbi:RidA family protein [Pseudoalteromonas tunicata]|jgi:enamine deaminase RidA (YjgF/YER057c/UK114 family)|uniref:Translation initiation inhibitor n=1 Tax=Pseudoalteromonas tunicata D2 TaxID=87626 RepID=A4C5A4_9GAMM|nr:RidA family protein [Pseudoalteromonas tunicata]ATC96791.1 hypothetical protein PTUN_b0397 [Pseudoalteromonas tunicata]AXT32937.1 RidA family protein [Pseudoalteromonas tunicata]EAR30736.1 translation initiation inhibitor [Pseudoalteromonas tunicata D2]MDP4984306.1 RidA family protein [Pseudoalteromonas tunicata]MDP5214730.1 RidA family protein [Pseudoalteromonas tunicata]